VTKKISEERIIQNFKKIADFELPSASVQRDLLDIRNLLSNRETNEFSAGRNVWRIIMHSKLTKYVSAAMVFFAVFISMQFLPGAELSAAELLTKVSKNMQKCKYVKSVTQSYLPGQEEPTDYVTSIIDYSNKQVFLIYSEGYLHQWDYQKMTSSIYRPEDNTMIIKKLSGEMGDPERQVEAYIEKLAQVGLEVRQSKIMENGIEFTVIEYDDLLNNISNDPNTYVSSMSMGGKPVKAITTKLMINRDDLFLGWSEISYYDPQDNLIVTKKTTSEPIDSAPADIYELGVPADLKIINKVPDKRVQEVRKHIEEHRDGFLKNYLAVQTEIDMTEEQPRLMEGTVIYCKGKKIRVDSFRSVYPSDKKKPIPAEAMKLLKDSLTLLEPYVSQTPRPRAIHLYDGLWQHIYEEQGDQMVLRKPHRRPDGDEYGDDDIDDFGWRVLWMYTEPEWVYEDDFSTENDLLGMEVTYQSQFSRLPERKVLYVDPAKDYLYRRYIEEKLIDAPWQNDNSWLDGVEKKDRLNEQVRIYDVTEYGQTSTGQWYPKTFTIKGYDCSPLSNYQQKDEFNRICRIYLLEENPDLPDTLFDPEQLSILGPEK
jgi:hypothetical protein